MRTAARHALRRRCQQQQTRQPSCFPVVRASTVPSRTPSLFSSNPGENGGGASNLTSLTGTRLVRLTHSGTGSPASPLPRPELQSALDSANRLLEKLTANASSVVMGGTEGGGGVVGSSISSSPAAAEFSSAALLTEYRSCRAALLRLPAEEFDAQARVMLRSIAGALASYARCRGDVYVATRVLEGMRSDALVQRGLAETCAATLIHAIRTGSPHARVKSKHLSVAALFSNLSADTVVDLVCAATAAKGTEAGAAAVPLPAAADAAPVSGGGDQPIDFAATGLAWLVAVSHRRTTQLPSSGGATAPPNAGVVASPSAAAAAPEPWQSTLASLHALYDETVLAGAASAGAVAGAAAAAISPFLSQAAYARLFAEVLAPELLRAQRRDAAGGIGAAEAHAEAGSASGGGSASISGSGSSGKGGDHPHNDPALRRASLLLARSLVRELRWVGQKSSWQGVSDLFQAAPDATAESSSVEGTGAVGAQTSQSASHEGAVVDFLLTACASAALRGSSCAPTGAPAAVAYPAAPLDPMQCTAELLRAYGGGPLLLQDRDQPTAPQRGSQGSPVGADPAPDALTSRAASFHRRLAPLLHGRTLLVAAAVAGGDLRAARIALGRLLGDAAEAPLAAPAPPAASAALPHGAGVEAVVSAVTSEGRPVVEDYERRQAERRAAAAAVQGARRREAWRRRAHYSAAAIRAVAAGVCVRQQSNPSAGLLVRDIVAWAEAQAGALADEVAGQQGASPRPVLLANGTLSLLCLPPVVEALSLCIRSWNGDADTLARIVAGHAGSPLAPARHLVMPARDVVLTGGTRLVDAQRHAAVRRLRAAESAAAAAVGGPGEEGQALELASPSSASPTADALVVHSPPPPPAPAADPWVLLTADLQRTEAEGGGTLVAMLAAALRPLHNPALDPGVLPLWAPDGSPSIDGSGPCPLPPVCPLLHVADSALTAALRSGSGSVVIAVVREAARAAAAAGARGLAGPASPTGLLPLFGPAALADLCVARYASLKRLRALGARGTGGRTLGAAGRRATTHAGSELGGGGGLLGGCDNLYSRGRFYPGGRFVVAEWRQAPASGPPGAPSPAPSALRFPPPLPLTVPQWASLLTAVGRLSAASNPGHLESFAALPVTLRSLHRLPLALPRAPGAAGHGPASVCAEWLQRDLLPPPSRALLLRGVNSGDRAGAGALLLAPPPLAEGEAGAEFELARSQLGGVLASWGRGPSSTADEEAASAPLAVPSDAGAPPPPHVSSQGAVAEGLDPRHLRQAHRLAAALVPFPRASAASQAWFGAEVGAHAAASDPSSPQAGAAAVAPQGAGEGQLEAGGSRSLFLAFTAFDAMRHALAALGAVYPPAAPATAAGAAPLGPSPSSPSLPYWGVLVEAAASAGQPRRALQVMEAAIAEGWQPRMQHYAAVVCALASAGDAAAAEELLGAAVALGPVAEAGGSGGGAVHNGPYTAVMRAWALAPMRRGSPGLGGDAGGSALTAPFLAAAGAAASPGGSGVRSSVRSSHARVLAVLRAAQRAGVMTAVDDNACKGVWNLSRLPQDALGPVLWDGLRALKRAVRAGGLPLPPSLRLYHTPAARLHLRSLLASLVPPLQAQSSGYGEARHLVVTSPELISWMTAPDPHAEEEGEGREGQGGAGEGRRWASRDGAAGATGAAPWTQDSSGGGGDASDGDEARLAAMRAAFFSHSLVPRLPARHSSGVALTSSAPRSGSSWADLLTGARSRVQAQDQDQATAAALAGASVAGARPSPAGISTARGAATTPSPPPPAAASTQEEREFAEWHEAWAARRLRASTAARAASRDRVIGSEVAKFEAARAARLAGRAEARAEREADTERAVVLGSEEREARGSGGGLDSLRSGSPWGVGGPDLGQQRPVGAVGRSPQGEGAEAGGMHWPHGPLMPPPPSPRSTAAAAAAGAGAARGLLGAGRRTRGSSSSGAGPQRQASRGAGADHPASGASERYYPNQDV